MKQNNLPSIIYLSKIMPIQNTEYMYVFYLSVGLSEYPKFFFRLFCFSKSLNGQQVLY